MKEKVTIEFALVSTPQERAEFVTEAFYALVEAISHIADEFDASLFEIVEATSALYESNSDDRNVEIEEAFESLRAKLFEEESKVVAE